VKGKIEMEVKDKDVPLPIPRPMRSNDIKRKRQIRHISTRSFLRCTLNHDGSDGCRALTRSCFSFPEFRGLRPGAVCQGAVPTHEDGERQF
jgi:hypothetical protein